MGRAIHMEQDIDVLKIKISNLEDSIENINKELEGLAKLQEIAVKASKTKPKPKLKTKTKKGA
jgi:predicted  nucleic acid-binding Zn-ribbon protein|tara:strand:+ start:113 stop:301 length:189 start_codon:yes stop_codon:yes gene_type:complete